MARPSLFGDEPEAPKPSKSKASTGPTPPRYKPQEEGGTHINVYSKSNTNLGRSLSNFADTPFELTGLDGVERKFRSVEGFWYFTKTGDPRFITMSGADAKSEGSKTPVIRGAPTKEELKEAYLAKLAAHPNIQKELLANTLPLAHYYMFGTRQTPADEYLWTAQLWEEIANELRKNPPTPIEQTPPPLVKKPRWQIIKPTLGNTLVTPASAHAEVGRIVIFPTLERGWWVPYWRITQLQGQRVWLQALPYSSYPRLYVWAPIKDLRVLPLKAEPLQEGQIDASCRDTDTNGMELRREEWGEFELAQPLEPGGIDAQLAKELYDTGLWWLGWGEVDHAEWLKKLQLEVAPV